MSWPKIFKDLTHLFLANPCALCKRPTSSVICHHCHRQLLSYRWSGSPNNRTRFGIDNPSAAPSNAVALPVFPWGKYSGLLKQTLTLLKYGNQENLGFWLGYQLGQAWNTQQQNRNYRPKPTVIPIPLHTDRLQQRGYNQAALIAKGFCRVTGLPLAEDVLLRSKATVAMHGLGAQTRKENLKNAFQLGIKRPNKHSPILMVDDIYTTGSTAQAASIPLVQAGYTIIGITTVARAVLSSTSVMSHEPCQIHQKPNSHPNP